MKAPPIGWFWPTTTGLAVVLAVVAGRARWLAATAATLAVVAATLTIVTELAKRRSRVVPIWTALALEPDEIRAAFRSGRNGQVDLVLACDLLERKILRPDLRAETPVELDAVARMNPEEFRRYLDRRLRALEAAS